MRKITFSALLSTALFCAGLGTATAQSEFINAANIKQTLTTTGVYRLHQDRGTVVSNANTSVNYAWVTTKTGAAAQLTADTEASENAFNFVIAQDDDKQYLYHLGKKNFFAPVSGGGFGTTWSFTGNAKPIVFTAMENNKVNIKTTDGVYASVSVGYNGPVISYYSQGDAGVPFTIEEVATATDEQKKEADDALTAFLIKNANDKRNTALLSGSYLGGLSATDIKTLENTPEATTREAAKALEAKIASFTPSGVDYTKYYTLISAFGGYMQIQHVEKAIISRGDNVNGNLGWETLDASHIGQLWQFEAVGDGMVLKSVNANKYAGSVPAPNQPYLLVTDKTNQCVLESFGAGTLSYKIKVANGVFHTVMHDNGRGQGSSVGNYNAGIGTASSWKIKEVSSIDVTVGDAGYATLNLPFAVKIPADVKAYTGTKNTNSFTLTPVEGTVIPAKTPVILEAAPKKYTFEIAYGDETPAIEKNDLKGVTMPETLPVGAFLLAKPSETVGFFKLGTAGQIDANKAYLAATTASAVDFLHFDWSNGITAITEAAADVTTPVQYYDLNGRLVTNPSRGIYVTSKGEKVFIQ